MREGPTGWRLGPCERMGRVRDAIDESDEAGDAKIDEATAAIARLLRS